jgi:hypothetical protein
MPAQLLTLREAAERYDTTHSALKQAVTKGKLHATKRGRDLFVTDAEMIRWSAARQHTGYRKSKEHGE